MELRRARANDFDAIVELQNANLSTNLTGEDRKDGFLSVAFSSQQFAEMDADLAVVVCSETDKVLGFLCATTPEYNHSFALPQAMIDRFPQVIFQGRPLSAWKPCLSGPVCIDRSVRGHGLIRSMYDELFAVISSKCEVAVVFVSEENTRSLRAHEKLGMERVDRFEFKSNSYVIMACRVTGSR